MPVTLQQIATRAGVTRSQVSRVLNGRYKENRPAIARKAEKIRAIAEEMGYRPNLAARSVSEGRFDQMGFITCGDLGFDWFAPALLHGIHNGLETAGKRLIVHELPGERLTDAKQIPRLFKQSAIDAMLVNLDAKLPAEVVDRFDEQPVPTVLLNQKRNTRTVYPDEVGGGRIAAAHLIRSGRERIGYACLFPQREGQHYSRADRLAGVRAGCRSARVRAPRVLDGHPEYRIASGNGADLMGDFLDAHPDLDALVCYGLLEAVAAVVAATRRGRRLPDDLRLLVFHDQIAHAMTGVPIDTLVIPFQGVGEHAVALAAAMVEGNRDRRPAAVAVPYRRMYRADTDSVHDPSDESP